MSTLPPLRQWESQMVPPQQGNLLVGIVNKTVRSSVRPKPGFGIGNRNQDQVLVSVSGPELFLPKPKLSPHSKNLPKIISVIT